MAVQIYLSRSAHVCHSWIHNPLFLQTNMLQINLSSYQLVFINTCPKFNTNLFVRSLFPFNICDAGVSHVILKDNKLFTSCNMQKQTLQLHMHLPLRYVWSHELCQSQQANFMKKTLYACSGCMSHRNTQTGKFIWGNERISCAECSFSKQKELKLKTELFFW